MLTTLTTVHVIICILLCLTVLLQFGKGAEIGAVMGGGASQNVFSSSGKGNFFTKLTTVLAIGFMVNSIVLTKLYSQENSDSLLSDSAPVATSIEDTSLDAAKKAGDKAAEAAATAKDAVKSATDKATATVKETAKKAKETATKAVNTAKETTTNSIDDIQEKVRSATGTN